MSGDGLLSLIASRRVARAWTAEPVGDDEIRRVVAAARWAPAAGNRRPHRFVAVRDPRTIAWIATMTPGLSARPAAIVAVCIDWREAAALGCRPQQRSLFIDVGTAAENMLLAVHALGLGGGPVTSFSRAAVQTFLDLPEWVEPVLLVCFGRPAPAASQRALPRRPIRLRDLVRWERWEPGRSADPHPEGRTPR